MGGMVRDGFLHGKNFKGSLVLEKRGPGSFQGEAVTSICERIGVSLGR